MQSTILGELRVSHFLLGQLTQAGAPANILDHKFDFQKRLVAALKDRAWFGSLRDFGNWWVAREQTTWHVERNGTRRTLPLNAPQPGNDLPLQLPKHYRLVKTMPETATTQSETRPCP